ncbi:hypothetical protein [Actinoplanes derwentensis]|uniref:PknH-like extracellular domain-containing protein n=1 Tax=Actinoplanes derwentensis TaxID=113562 RepID=A0A1H1YP26_9ACTN|nr:hypothetical protein [Actinoplanes derwentensis]GID81228.1 hypothetical protein Ade03nite_01520 [Actinoplanes derwentensis]SDT23184.1 hypothetical protein SAMN04489716_2937 [Actinoplanes derwentensis]
MRFAAGAGLLAVSLAGCASGTVTSGSSVPSPVAVSASTAAAVSGIPAEALLQSADTRGAEAQSLEQGVFPHVRPLRPCGATPYPSDSTRTDVVAMRYTVPGAEQASTPSTVVQFVGRHQAGGAAAQFTEIGAALEKCPGGLGKDQHKWTIVDSDADSMLVRIEQKVSYGDEDPATVAHYAALSTVNDAVVVVADLGWENMDGSEQLVRDLIAKAEERAAKIK